MSETMVPVETLTTDELVRQLHAEVAEMRATIQAQVELLQMIQSEVKPVLDSLMANPMMRMMFGGNKNGTGNG